MWRHVMLYPYVILFTVFPTLIILPEINENPAQTKRLILNFYDY